MSAHTIFLSAFLGDDGCQRLHTVLAHTSDLTIAIDSADAHARLPTPLLAAVLAAVESTAALSVRIVGLSDHARMAVGVIDIRQRIDIGTGERTIPAAVAGDAPYSVSLAADGSVLVSVGKSFVQHAMLSHPASHQWARGLAAPRMAIDLVNVDHINSLIVAWMLQLAQAGAPARMELVNVNRQVSTQLKQLRLDHIITIV